MKNKIKTLRILSKCFYLIAVCLVVFKLFFSQEMQFIKSMTGGSSDLIFSRGISFYVFALVVNILYQLLLAIGGAKALDALADILEKLYGDEN